MLTSNFARSGVCLQPGHAVLPVAGKDILKARPSPQHPPGLYGPETGLRALNVTTRTEAMAKLTEMGVRFPQGDEPPAMGRP